MRRNITFRALMNNNFLLDKDDNRYTSVVIGNLEWIKQNYRVTQYADGEPILNLTSENSTNLLTGWTNSSFNVLVSSGPDISSASHGTITNGQIYSNFVSLVTGDILILNINIILISGTLPKVVLSRLFDRVEERTLVYGQNTLIFNITTTGPYYITIENQRLSTSFNALCSLSKSTQLGFFDDINGAYCWYANLALVLNPSSFKRVNGALYNYYAIENSHDFVYLKRRGVRETGWRVPTIYDWDNLLNQIGGYLIAGSLKETGTTLTPAGHWTTPNTGAANERKMRIIGTGSRLTTLGFNNIYKLSSFWSTTPYDISPLGSILTKKFVYDSSEVSQEEQNRNNGLSVRLVRGLINAAKYFALYNWYAVNKGIVPPPAHEYGALYNWYAATHQRITVKYGYLYNWYAAADARNIANTGWHVPINNDLAILNEFIEPGASDNLNTIGGKLKETGTTYWESPNTAASNFYGFNLRGTGSRAYDTGTFGSLRLTGWFWHGEEAEIPFEDNAYCTYLNYNSGAIYSYLPYGGKPWRDKHNGLSIRLVKDLTTLTHGQTSTYVGNNGKIYATICIGTQEWLSANLAETKYRNGDSVPIVTDNSTWVALVTGARCSYDNDESNAFTFNYDIAPTGWHVPTGAELNTLIAYLGGWAVAGGKLKEIGFTHWESPNLGATNETGFNGIGGGSRGWSDGLFTLIKLLGAHWLVTENPSNPGIYESLVLDYSEEYLYPAENTGYMPADGHSIRCLLDGVDPADPGTVTDIEGNIYSTVKIGTQVWMAENLKVTKYNDVTPIPEVTDNAAWAALITGARCYYNNTP